MEGRRETCALSASAQIGRKAFRLSVCLSVLGLMDMFRC